VSLTCCLRKGKIIFIFKFLDKHHI
jgi:hypothetical protein